MSQHPLRSITVLGKDLITDNFPTVSLLSQTLVSSLECWIMMFINYYITRPTYYTCVQLQFDRLRVVIKRLIIMLYVMLWQQPQQFRKQKHTAYRTECHHDGVVDVAVSSGRFFSNILHSSSRRKVFAVTLKVVRIIRCQTEQGIKPM